jgi:hypothetical protein
MPTQRKIKIRDGIERDEWLYNELLREGYSVSSNYFIKKDKVSALSVLANTHSQNCELDEVARAHNEECYFENNSASVSRNTSNRKTNSALRGLSSGKKYPSLDGKKMSSFWAAIDKWDVKVGSGREMRPATRVEKVFTLGLLLLIIIPLFFGFFAMFGGILLPVLIFWSFSKKSSNANRKF